MKAPAQRWPSLLQPDFRYVQQIPDPGPPTALSKEILEAGKIADAEPSKQLLTQVIKLLEPVDVCHLHFTRPGPTRVPSVSQLQKHILEVLPGIFDHGVAGPSFATTFQEIDRALPEAPLNRPSPESNMANQDGKETIALSTKLRHSTAATAVDSFKVDDKECAASYTASVSKFLHEHGSLLQTPQDYEDIKDNRVTEISEDQEDKLAANPTSIAKRWHDMFTDVTNLREETVQVCQGGLAYIEIDILVKLLQLLRAIIQRAIGKCISDEDQGGGGGKAILGAGLEAATCALKIMTVPNLNLQVYDEDLIQSIINLTKFSLTYSVYPLHDGRFLQHVALMTSGEANVEVSGNKRQAWISSTANVMYDRCQSNLGLLAELFRMVTVSAAEVAPLVRTSMKSLTVAGIPLLQGKAVDLIVSAFQNCPSARQALLEDFFAHVVNYSIPSKRPSRDFVCEERGGLKIQMFTAAILQMVQAAVSLPALDTDPSRLHQCYTPAMHWSDAFWSLCFSRLPSARAQKSDADQDFKLILEGVLQDLLSILFHSEWPAAPVLLSRFFTILNSQKGLQHADGHVRQICVDFLGLIAARLHKLQVPFQGDCEWLQQQAEGHKSTLDSVYGLLLHHLSGKAQSSTFKLARRFLICRSFAEEASSLQNKGASPEELQQLLFKFRHQEDELDSHCGEIPISSEDAQRCSRAMVQKMLGNARHTAVLWLLDMMDVKQLPTTRAKSVKALGLVVEADPAVLNSIDVQKAVEKSLQDESVSVREAALELLGCHISGNQGLAVHLFPILAKASTDSGTSVRKRAINILWESCIRSPGFPYATEACKHIMMRAGDNEKSIQDLVSKVFHNLWFTPCVETGALAPATVRSSAQRAQQLADVALAVYEAGGKAIHLPLDMNHPLVVVLQSAISYDAKGDLKKEWAAGREISQALLDEYLQAEEVAVADALNGDGPCSCPGFAYLLSLHAFAVADIYLCMPTKDPTSFVRVLAPYLKPCQGSRKLNIVEERRNAEEVLCILSVLEGIMSQMMSLDGLDVHEMVQDLLSLINTTSYILVVGAACKCLCTIAAVCKQSASELAALAAVYHNLLQKPDGSAGLVARYLFTLGHLCRYGADTIEENKPVGSDALTIQDCLSTFCSFYYCQQAELRVREAALQAVGLLTIARPSTVIKSRDAASMMQSALQADSPIGLKVRALNNLNEMLKSDEEQLLIRQQEGIDGPGRVPVKKQRRAVQSQNGQGDSLSISSGILQYHWDSVLRLATDTTAVSPNTLASNSGIIVRRQALALIETVLRGGLVAPWTAVPPLVALVTDPNDDVRLKAMKLLKQEAEKRSDFLENKLSLGVIEAFKFHSGLAQSGAVRMPKGLLPKHAAAGLKLLYKELVQPSKSLRTSFLQSLLKRFDAVSTSRNVKPDELPLLRFCAALTTELPYKRGDEPCSIVHQINAIVARRGGGVLQEFRVAMHSQEDSHQAELPSLCRSSLLLSMLLLLKEFLKKSYSINAERIASFGPSGERRKQEERTPVSLLDGFACRLDKLELDACSSQQKIRQQYTVFKHLMSHDAADYEHLARPTSKQAAVTPAGAEDAAAVTPIETGTDDGAPGWVLEAGGIANVKTGRRGGRRGGASTTGLKPPRTAKTASGVPKGGSKKKRKKMQSSEDDPDDEDYDPTGKGTKKRLDL